MSTSDTGVVTATIKIGAESTTIEITGGQGRTSYEIPRGVLTLHRTHITADPPLPQNLTNAIGDMMDHLDDAIRELPLLSDAHRIVVAGAVSLAMTAVEIGSHHRTGEFTLSRDAAEDVFRTMATESLDQRRLNPGLPPALAATMPAGCCAIVAVFRSLQLGHVVVPDT